MTVWGTPSINGRKLQANFCSRMQSKDAYMLVYVRETIRSMDQVHVTPPPMAMEEIERSNTDLNEEIAKHREK